MSSLHLFRKVAITEAISYLVLLFIAMPLKYFMGLPLAVKYVGWVHGLLFVSYVVCLIMAAQEQKWGFGKITLLFIASLLPFVPFWIDKQLKQEEVIEK